MSKGRHIQGGEPPLPVPDMICPVDIDAEDENDAYEEGEPEEVRYECDVCGFVFTEPGRTREGRGGFWGASAYEDIACCPRCKSGGFIAL